MKRLAILALILCLPAAAKDKKKKDPTQIGNRDVGKGINFYSLEKEIALGKQLAQEVQRQARLVDEPIIAEYVNRVGQNLVRNSDAKVPFSFRVIDDQALNAFAFPGGFIFVNTGLIKLAESESELAGAMAHEIAHVAARHITRQATRSQIANFATIPLLVIGGWTGYAVRQGAGLGIPMTFLKFDWGFEEEADYLGLQYLWAAGYDPGASVDIFERIQAFDRRKPGIMSKVFSSHPMTSDRIQKTQKEIQEILPNKPEYVVNTSEFDQVKSRLVALENRRKGQDNDPNRPRLRQAPGGTAPKEDPDERPTIKRREWVD
jgi:predicted Zn-dependent protease